MKQAILEKAKALLAKANILITGDHFVYKAGTHGSAYLDKEGLARLDVGELKTIMDALADKVVASGLLDKTSDQRIGIIGPAYGAISLAALFALALEEKAAGSKTFFIARTELKESDGKKVHYIPEKLLPLYKGKTFIILDDILNNGTTFNEVGQLFAAEADALILANVALINRGGQAAYDVLKFGSGLALFEFSLEQHPADACPHCAAGTLIRTDLGKGKEYVAAHGQPQKK